MIKTLQNPAEELLKIFKAYIIGFVSVKSYTNIESEVSDRLVNVGYKYENLKKDDLETLQKGVEYIRNERYTRSEWNEALAELIESLINPNPNRSNGQKDAYITLTENGAVKWNIEKQRLYVAGLELSGSKKILEEGEYKVDTRKPKTIAKDAIRKAYMKTAKIRTFIVDNIGQLKMQGDTLIIG